jgi:hypothetical protein
VEKVVLAKDAGGERLALLGMSAAEENLAKEVSEFQKKTGGLYKVVFGDGEGNASQLLHDSQISADAVVRLSGDLITELGNAEQLTDLPDAEERRRGVVAFRKKMLAVQHFLLSLQDILGIEKKKTYAVFVQNSQELRPTGGFLSSVGILTVDKGRVLDFETKDVVLLDSLLNGEVSPPEDVKKILGEEQWFLRDSNWNASVPVAARQAEWFLKKELGIAVDGSIFITPEGLKNILSVTGPVALSDVENEEVSASNLNERLQKKTELSFARGGGGRREYLSSVLDGLFGKMKKIPEDKVQDLGMAVFSSLEKSNILATFKNPETETTFSALAWNGEISTPPCPPQFSQKKCVVDTIYAVDANVGINKVNPFIQRSSEHRVVLSEGAAVHTHIIRYSNQAPSSAWPLGRYKNYLRLYVPSSAQVNTVTVGGEPVAESDLFFKVEGQRKVAGVVMEVPVGKAVEVEFKYVTPIDGQGAFSYALFEQKQPGLEPYPSSFFIQVQKPLQIATVAPKAEIVGNIVQFDQFLEKSVYMAVEVLK